MRFRGTLWLWCAICVVGYAPNASADELLSSGLCRGQHLFEKECLPAQLLRGEGILIRHGATRRICLVSVYRAAQRQELTHVWFFNGRRMPQVQPTVWVEQARSFLDNVSSELDWLKNQKNVGVVSAVAAVVKLVVEPSRRFRTLSCKTLSEEWVGPWQAHIYDERSSGPLASYAFGVE